MNHFNLAPRRFRLPFSLKNHFPFRLGTTSYIIPADILPNIQFLAEQVDDIELVLFESSDISNLPDKKTINEIKFLADNYKLSYTVHLPLDILFGSLDEDIRQNSVEKCVQVVQLTEPLQPFAYILHLTGNPEITGVKGKEIISQWLSSIRKSCDELNQYGILSKQFCIETLNYPFSFVKTIIDEFNFSVCLDVGHILLNEFSLIDYLDKYWDKTRVVHLHGILNKTDHQSIVHFPKDKLKLLLEQMGEISSTERVLTLEVFSRDDFESSVLTLREYK